MRVLVLEQVPICWYLDFELLPIHNETHFISEEVIDLTGRSTGNPFLLASSTSSVVYITVKNVLRRTSNPIRTSSSSSIPNSKHNLSNSSVAGKHDDQAETAISRTMRYNIHGRAFPRDLLCRRLRLASRGMKSMESQVTSESGNEVRRAAQRRERQLLQSVTLCPKWP